MSFASALTFKVRLPVMFRYALATYMLMLSLTGPNPCCCTFARFAALATSWAGTGENQGVQWASCCQQQLASDSDDKEDKAPSHSRLPTERCKCEKSLCNAVPSPSTDFTIEMNRSWLDDLALNLAAPLMREADDIFAMVGHPDGTPPAARSGREIRVALHSWQC